MNKQDIYEHKYTSIKMWIDVLDQNQAKELHEKYFKIVITKMEKLQVSYHLYYLKYEDDNRYFSNFYYSYHVSFGMEPSFEFIDKVNNESKKCNRNNIVLKENVINCNLLK